MARVEKHGVTRLEVVGLPGFVGGIYHSRLGDCGGIGQLLEDVAHSSILIIRYIVPTVNSINYFAN